MAHGLLDGNHPDDCVYPEGTRPESNGMLPRKLIDAIVDEVCACTTERDQQVQLQVVRALLTIVATSSTEVHEKSLLKVVSSLYYIHIACANQVNQNTAKASLIQMISIIFKKLEHHSGEFSESLRRLSESSSTLGDSTRPKTSSNFSHTRVAQSMGDVLDQNSGSQIHSGKTPEGTRQSASSIGRDLSSRNEESKRDEFTTPGLIGDNTQVTFTPEEQYA